MSKQALLREVRRRRTFAIISHPDAGKTTLTEKLLLFGGAIQMAGAVKGRKAARHATSDWMEVEKQRGISVTSSVMQFEYKDHIVNLLDTPGHEDFSEDTYRVLTAVDAAVMVIDAAKGVEAQTIKLLNVCRMRNTPIITFINKLDREVRDPLDLLGEIESVLKLQCVPITWPIGMGKTFRGVFNLRKNHLVRFEPGTEKLAKETELIEGLDNPRLDELFPMEMPPVREAVELVQGATEPFSLDAFLAGQQSPVFFGSGVNNFGVEDVLEALLEWAPQPQPRDAGTRTVDPLEEPFTGFVFKIQANMDPRHRDRIAFFRVCSGVYQPGMKVRHVREGREMKIANALTFMANERVHMQEAYAGDIIGIYNHGQLHIGDTLTEGETLGFTGIPYFAPELFVRFVRHAFMAKKRPQELNNLLAWASDVSALSRESQKRFLEYACGVFRQGLMNNYGVTELVLPQDFPAGFNFGGFSQYVHGRNIADIYRELTDAQYHIERNANSKMVFFDTAVKITRYLHAKPV